MENKRTYEELERRINDLEKEATGRKRMEEALKSAFAKSQQREREVSALLKGTRAVQEYHEFSKTARSIYDTCKELIGSIGGYVALLSPDGAENEVLFLDSGGLSCSVDESLPMPIRGLRADAYNSCKTVYDNDFPNSAWMEFMPEGHVVIENVMFAPLIFKGKAIGLLGFADKPGGFTEDDTRIASAFGDIAAMALQNSRTLELLERSERKRMESEICKLNDELEQRVVKRTVELSAVNAELEAFAYSVSHDLRAPLRAIDGFSLALLEDFAENLDVTGKEYLHRIRNATQRMGELIDDLLALSRVSRTEIKPKHLDLGAIAKTVAKDLHKSMPKRQVDFIIQKRVFVKGDAHLMRLLMENLLGNAFKFTSKHPKARIEFGVTQIEGKSAYFVRDNGVGFDMAYSDKLFGAFQRLHSTAEFPGSGIGLATVQRIVHRHGGRVWAEAIVEKGATFYFTI